MNLIGINLHKNDVCLIENNRRTVKDYEVWGFCKVLKIDYTDLYKGINKIIDD